MDLAQNGTQLSNLGASWQNYKVGYFKGIHPVVFGFYVNLVSIYANRKSLCSGNFSNPEKLPGEFDPVVFGFYVTWVSIYANCKWLCCGNFSNSEKLPRPKLSHLPQFSSSCINLAS